jgi:hypothetical protein
MLHAREAGDFVELLLLYDTVKSRLTPAFNLRKYSYNYFLPRPLLYEFHPVLLYSPVTLLI